MSCTSCHKVQDAAVTDVRRLYDPNHRIRFMKPSCAKDDIQVYSKLSCRPKKCELCCPCPRGCPPCVPTYLGHSPRHYCVWKLPKFFDTWAQGQTSQYQNLRDWRRFQSEVEPEEHNYFECSCDGIPSCSKQTEEWPPFLGQHCGARYLAWSHPRGFHYPRSRPFHFQSFYPCN